MLTLNKKWSFPLRISSVNQWRNCGGWGTVVQVVRKHHPDKIAALFCPFSKKVFFKRPFCNEGNILTSGILETSDRRTKICSDSEVITYVWGSELTVLLYHLLLPKVFFLLIYVTVFRKRNRFVEVLLFCYNKWLLRKLWNNKQKQKQPLKEVPWKQPFLNFNRLTKLLKKYLRWKLFVGKVL